MPTASPCLIRRLRRALVAAATRRRSVGRPHPARRSVAIALQFLHSLLDYPLRTTSNAVLSALAGALLLPAPQARMRPPVRPREPSLRRPVSSSAVPAIAPAPATPWKGRTEVHWPDAWQGERAKSEHELPPARPSRLSRNIPPAECRRLTERA